MARFHAKMAWVAYFAFGVAVAVGFASLLTFLPSAGTLPSIFTPGFTGEPVGDAVGDGDGLAVTTGVGVATGGFGGSGFGSHAPSTATLAAKTVESIIDLLIVILLILFRHGLMAVRWQTSAAGMMGCVFLQKAGVYSRQLPHKINAALDRTRVPEKLAWIYVGLNRAIYRGRDRRKSFFRWN